MKLIALHDKDGKILAAVKHTPSYSGPVPVAGEGTRIIHIDLEPAHAELKLHHLCQQFRVHPESGKLVERQSADTL